ncbi:MAG: DegV family protein [Bacillota bacterium]
MGYIIMTDSDSELDYAYAKAHGVLMLMMPYTHMGEEHAYCPSYDFDTKKFYDELRRGAVPTTACPNPHDFLELWEPVLNNGDDIAYIALSSTLSNTFENAALAREEALEQYPERTIRLVDSKRISMALGILVMLAAKMKEQGKPMDEVCDWVEANRLRARAWFTVDDLHYLSRGGRLSGSAAFFGTILDVKPILTINDEGKLVPVDKIKGRKKALRYMLEKMEGEAADPADNIAAICQADCYDDAKAIKERLEERYDYKQIIINPVGPVVGSHVGPGTLGICYMTKGR